MKYQNSEKGFLMDPDKSKQIGWFMNFLNIDYDKASFKERSNLLEDMRLSFGRTLHSDFSDYESQSLSIEMKEVLLAEKGETAKRLQNKLTELVDGMNQGFQKIKNSPSKESESLNIEEVEDLRVLDRININVSNVRIIIENKPKIIRHPEKRQMWKVYWPDGTLENSPIRLDIIPNEDDEGFAFTFLKSIEGIPLSFIRRCEECRKWFVQKSKHDQIFCSVNCRARKHVRAWRTNKKEKDVNIEVPNNRSTEIRQENKIKEKGVRKIRFPKGPKRERED